MSLVLFVLWALSPLASQGLQRMAYTAASNATLPLEVSYTRNSDQGFNNRAYSGPDVLRREAFFGAALLSSYSAQTSAQDTWGNPKVPVIEMLKNPDKGWYNVDNKTSDWTSLIGTPYSATLADGKFRTEYVFDTAYFAFNCTPFSNVSASLLDVTLRGSLVNTKTMAMYVENTAVSGNGTIHWAFTGYFDPEVGPSYYGVSTCQYSLVQVSAKVGCTSQEIGKPSCMVVKIRNTTVEALVRDYGMNSVVGSNLLDVFPAVLNSTSSLTEMFLQKPDAVFDPKTGFNDVILVCSSHFSYLADFARNWIARRSPPGSGYCLILGFNLLVIRELILMVWMSRRALCLLVTVPLSILLRFGWSVFLGLLCSSFLSWLYYCLPLRISFGKQRPLVRTFLDLPVGLLGIISI